MEGNFVKFGILLRCGRFDPNLRGYGCETPIYTAVKYGNYGALGQLLDLESVDVSIATDSDDTTLALAKRVGEPVMLRQLLHSIKIDACWQAHVEEDVQLAALNLEILWNVNPPVDWNHLLWRLKSAANQSSEGDETISHRIETFDEAFTDLQ